MQKMYLKNLNVKSIRLFNIIFENRYLSFIRYFQKFSNFAYETYELDPRH